MASRTQTQGGLAHEAEPGEDACALEGEPGVPGDQSRLSARLPRDSEGMTESMNKGMSEWVQEAGEGWGCCERPP